jgi:hypothetical protein
MSARSKRRRSQGALMKKVLLAAVVALSVLGAPPTHADGFEEFGKAMKAFFDLLDTTWLGSVWRADMPPPWNGRWPEHTVILDYEPGGIVGEHLRRWMKLASSGDDVEIRGPCYSACTLIVGYVPKERLCFGDYASLNFHHAGSTLSAADAVAATRHMFSLYPREIREWISKQGGAEHLPMFFMGWWTLEAEDLWEMGYRRCEPKPAPPMIIGPPPPRPPYVGYRPVWK